ncbi:hypothetical protein LY05_02894 [Oceanicella actignis]|nr:hypothetical protein LY05_02894 [Oceanicella actignis]
MRPGFAPPWSWGRRAACPESRISSPPPRECAAAARRRRRIRHRPSASGRRPRPRRIALAVGQGERTAAPNAAGRGIRAAPALDDRPRARTRCAGVRRRSRADRRWRAAAAWSALLGAVRSILCARAGRPSASPGGFGAGWRRACGGRLPRRSAPGSSAPAGRLRGSDRLPPLAPLAVGARLGFAPTGSRTRPRFRPRRCRDGRARPRRRGGSQGHAMPGCRRAPCAGGGRPARGRRGMNEGMHGNGGDDARSRGGACPP